MSNLFSGWDKNNLAVVATYISNPSFEVCEKYYRLGSLEYKPRFPFNLNPWSGTLDSGIITPHAYSNSEKTTSNIKIPLIKILYEKVLAITGLVHYKRKFKISDELLRWIKDFSPDIIYSQLASLEEIRLVNDLYKLLKLPGAVHIMDDWPQTISDGYFPKFLWKKIINREFRALLSDTSLFFSISEAMTDEYLKRYGIRFFPFHNPVVAEDWLPFSKNYWEIEGEFKILYTGRIGKANGKAIIFMAKIINELNLKETRIKLDIYTPDYNSSDALSIKDLRGVYINQTVHYNMMPSLMSHHDLLFLPLDFDEEGIRFAQYSMPTKTSEYMISGTPVLVFADLRTALAKYATEERWAYVVSENNKGALINAVNELSSSISLRKSYAEKARETAMRNENAQIVRENFRRALMFEAI